MFYIRTVCFTKISCSFYQYNAVLFFILVVPTYCFLPETMFHLRTHTPCSYIRSCTYSVFALRKLCSIYENSHRVVTLEIVLLSFCFTNIMFHLRKHTPCSYISSCTYSVFAFRKLCSIYKLNAIYFS